MGLFCKENENDPRRARIVDEESPVCTLSDRVNTYDPDSLKKAFHPLGIYSKCFGLFPCYDFTFVEKMTVGKIKVIHIVDYCYSALIFFLLTGGALLCYIYKPGSITKDEDSATLDYYVKLTLIYATILAGVHSLFLFPMAWKRVLHFVVLFSNIDKILRFDGRMEERWFAKKVMLYLTGCLVFTFTSFMILFLFDNVDEDNRCFTDYLMAPIMTLALMVLIVPTGLAIFFLHAIQLRMVHFNRQLKQMLLPVTPSCCTCVSIQDYGKELDRAKLDKKVEVTLEENLEKMRILHCEIRMLVYYMGGIFGMHLVRDFLYSLVALVLYTYFLIYAHNEDGVYTRITYGVQSVFIILKILVIVCFAQLICCAVCSQKLVHKYGINQSKKLISLAIT